jgi:hypothetical protein
MKHRRAIAHAGGSAGGSPRRRPAIARTSSRGVIAKGDRRPSPSPPGFGGGSVDGPAARGFRPMRAAWASRCSGVSRSYCARPAAESFARVASESLRRPSACSGRALVKRWPPRCSRFVGCSAGCAYRAGPFRNPRAAAAEHPSGSLAVQLERAASARLEQELASGRGSGSSPGGPHRLATSRSAGTIHRVGPAGKPANLVDELRHSPTERPLSEASRPPASTGWPARRRSVARFARSADPTREPARRANNAGPA